MRRKRRVYCLLFSLVLILLLLGFGANWYLRRKISTLSSGVLKLGSVSVSGRSVKLKNVCVSLPVSRWRLELETLAVRPSFKSLFRPSNLAFAFSGPGQVASDGRKQPLHLSGTISGNFKSGDVSISRAKVTFPHLGELEVTGNLKDWGKEDVSLNGQVKDLALQALKDFFQFTSPVAGRVNGEMTFLVGKKQNVQRVDFNLNLDGLHTEGSPGLLSGEVKGTYDLAGKKADFAGNLKHPEGDRILFTAAVRDQDFSLQFDSEGLSLDTVLELLPESWRKKINPQKYQADKKKLLSPVPAG
jgi:hypothetical protein